MQRLRNEIVRIAAGLAANDVVRGSATALALKVTGAVLNFVMFALLSRQYGHDAFGSFAVILNALAFLAALAPCGQEVLISRSWGEYVGSNRPALARGVLTFAMQVVSAVAVAAAVAAAVVWPHLDRTVSMSLVLSACTFFVAQSFMHFAGQFSRVAAGVLVGDWPREILWRGIVVGALLAHQVFGYPFGTSEFFFVAAAGLVLGLAIQFRTVARFIPDEVKRAKAQRDVGTWVPISFRMWLSALSEIAAQYLEVVVIGICLGPTVAGFYFIVTRITSVFAMLSAGTSMYASSLISALYYSDGKTRLQEILRSLSLMNAALTVGALLAVLAGGDWLLWLFGPAYVSAYPSLVVMAAGAAAAAITGPAGTLLILTGREGVYPLIMGAGLVLRFVLIVTLGSQYGLLGAALGWSISAIAIALVLTIACRRLVGLDPCPATSPAQWPAMIVRLGGK